MLNWTPSLNNALAQLKRAAGDDPHAKAVLNWAESGDLAFLRTIGLTYKDSTDDSLRLLAQAAANFVDQDMRPPAFNDVTALLNLSNEAYRNGDCPKAYVYLQQMLRMRPGWQNDPVILDYTALLNAGLVHSDRASSLATQLPAESDRWPETVIWLVGYALLFAVGIGLLSAVMANALPAIRSARSVNPRLQELLVAQLNWISEHQLTLALAAAGFVIVDVLVRSSVLHFFAQQITSNFEPAYAALIRKLVQLQLMVVLAGVAGALALGGRSNPLAVVWQLGVVVGYVMFLTRHLTSTYTLSTGKAIVLILVMSVGISVVESFIVGGIVSSAFR